MSSPTTDRDKQAWLACTRHLASPSVASLSAFNDALPTLRAAFLTRSLSLWALLTFENHVRERVAVPLTQLCHISPSDDDVFKAVSTAHDAYISARSAIQTLDSIPECRGIARRFQIRVSAMLNHILPPAFSDVVYALFNSQQRQFEAGMQPIQILKSSCSQMLQLGFTRIVEHATSRVVFDRIDMLVISKVKHSIYTETLPHLKEWVSLFINSWVSPILKLPASETGADQKQHIQVWRRRLQYHLHESVVRIRTEQILRLIMTFPHSTPALLDLKHALSCTDQKSIMTQSLREQFCNQYLNAGTMTSDILQQYVNLIRTLRFLDPTGVILENVSHPIRQYLKRRPDTVRCIVSEMTGDGELYRELERGGNDGDGDIDMEGLRKKLKIRDDDDCLSIDADYDVDGNIDWRVYEEWQPDPIDAPLRGGKWKRGGDAIATLVAIYGSSEQIVNEYRGVLAEKLVSAFDVDLEREGRILGLLSERFGEQAMHECCIMVKDVEESRKVLRKSAEKKASQKQISMNGFEVMVISKEFWPKLVEEPKFQMGAEMLEKMSAFEEAFMELKKPRKLNWQEGVGIVSVSMQFEDGREVDMDVTPLQASILTHFGERSKWSIDELCAKTGIDDSSVVRRKVQSLASMGILRAVSGNDGVFESVEDGGDIEGGIEEDVEEVEEEDDGDSMKVYESYIMAMLQNLKQLPLERIDSMLRMFVQTPAYDRSHAQLAAFLQQLIAQGKVELAAGVYRIKK